MEGASNYGYISRRKLKRVAQLRAGKNEDRERSRSRSIERATEVDAAALSHSDLRLPVVRLGTYEQEVDTNIISVKVGELLATQNISKGYLTRCKECKAILSQSSLSSVNFKEDIWKCEFCGFSNRINLKKSEFPETGELLYPLGVADEVGLDENFGDVRGQELSIVFAIDLSGSMDESFEWKGEKCEYQRYPEKISRLECVKTAVCKQLSRMMKTESKTRVGFVTFDSTIDIIGDGSMKRTTLPNECMYSYGKLVAYVSEIAGKYMSKPLQDSCTTLLKSLHEIESGMNTALGPGLLAATVLAARGKVGSKVIICTDGIANEGLGKISLIPNGTTKTFYNSVGEYARSKGVSISVISIIDKECRLDMLSPIANLTGGDVVKVDPKNLTEEFSSLLSDENRTLASNVKVRVHLPKPLTFRNEDLKDFEDGTLHKSLGNVTNNSIITFEYTAKDSKILAKIPDFNPEAIKTIPVQAQIAYVAPDENMYLKVITRTQSVTSDKTEAKKHANTKIIALHAKKKTAELAHKGDLQRAIRNALVHTKLATDLAGYQQELGSLYGAIQNESQTLRMIPDSQSDWLTTEINQAFRGSKK